TLFVDMVVEPDEPHQPFDGGNFPESIIALDAHTGKEKWRNGSMLQFEQHVDGQSTRSDHLMEKRIDYLSIAGGSLVFGVNGSIGNPKLKYLYALDRNSGQLNWKFETEGVPGAAVYANGILYFTDTNSNL